MSLPAINPDKTMRLAKGISMNSIAPGKQNRMGARALLTFRSFFFIAGCLHSPRSGQVQV